MEKRLYRSRTDRMISGVCGGLAEYFDVDPTIIRIAFVVLTLISGGFGLIAYIILALVVPLEDSKATEPKEAIKENVAEIKETANKIGQEIRSTFAAKEEDKPKAERKNRHFRRSILGITLIVLGIIFLLASFNIFWWFQWRYLWPIILVAIGLVIIFGVRRK